MFDTLPDTDDRVPPVPDYLPRVQFTDQDGETLTIRPLADDTYYVQIIVGDGEVWLTPTQAMALADVAEKTAAAVGAARITVGRPLADESEPESPFRLVD